MRELAADADVVLENFKVGGLKAYGLDYASLAALNPRLVYCSITGFGQDGPYAERAGYDFLIQGMGGLMSITGEPDGEAGRRAAEGRRRADRHPHRPLRHHRHPGARWRHRERHPAQGQHIDLALLDVQVACLANQAMNYLVSGSAPRRMGNAHPNIVPYQDFPTADGDMILAIGNDGQFARFCNIAGHAGMGGRPRALPPTRRGSATASELIPLLRQATVMKTTADWIAALENAAVPCGPINDLAAVFADPQVAPSRPARRAAPRRGRHGATGRQPDPLFGDAGPLPACAPRAGAGHRRRYWGNSDAARTTSLPCARMGSSETAKLP